MSGVFPVGRTVRRPRDWHLVLGSSISTIPSPVPQHLLVPRFVSISTISSLPTCPSPSRSNTWNPSRISLACAAGNFDSASPLTAIGLAVRFDCVDTVLAPRVGEVGSSRCAIAGLKPRGVQLPSFDKGLEVFWSLEGDWRGVLVLLGDGEGEVGRKDGEGDSGRRNGEVRGEPKERGDGDEGLYVAGMA